MGHTELPNRPLDHCTPAAEQPGDFGRVSGLGANGAPYAEIARTSAAAAQKTVVRAATVRNGLRTCDLSDRLGPSQ